MVGKNVVATFLWLGLFSGCGGAQERQTLDPDLESAPVDGAEAQVAEARENLRWVSLENQVTGLQKPVLLREDQVVFLTDGRAHFPWFSGQETEIHWSVERNQLVVDGQVVGVQLDLGRDSDLSVLTDPEHRATIRMLVLRNAGELPPDLVAALEGLATEQGIGMWLESSTGSPSLAELPVCGAASSGFDSTGTRPVMRTWLFCHSWSMSVR